MTLLVWLALLYAGFCFLTLFEIYTKEYTNYWKWGSFAVFFVFISSVRIPRFLSEKVVNLISSAGDLALQIVLAVVVFAFLFISFIYFSSIKRALRSTARNNALNRTTKKLEVQSRRLDSIEKGSKKNKKKDLDEEVDEEAKEAMEGAGDE